MAGEHTARRLETLRTLRVRRWLFGLITAGLLSLQGAALAHDLDHAAADLTDDCVICVSGHLTKAPPATVATTCTEAAPADRAVSQVEDLHHRRTVAPYAARAPPLTIS